MNTQQATLVTLGAIAIIEFGAITYLAAQPNQPTPQIDYNQFQVDYNQIQNACQKVTLSTTCPSELCYQRDLLIPFEETNYYYDSTKKQVTVYGVDYLSFVSGNSMLPALQPKEIVFWQKFSGDWQDLKPNQIIMIEHNGEKIAHAIKAVYPDRVLLYGINSIYYNLGNNTYPINEVKYVQSKPSQQELQVRK